MQESHPICYVSRALAETEQKYLQTDGEYLAVVYGVARFPLCLETIL